MTRAFTFVGGEAGAWRVVGVAPVTGEPLAQIARVAIVNRRLDSLPAGARWLLRGVTSHERYVTRDEQELRAVKTPALGRAGATCAALIPIKKSASWWDLAQDERRVIFETRSEHIKMGMQYLPAVARRLHHCRDLAEPFDFLTWFEYAPSDSSAFEELVGRLRRTEEWKYVEREVDIRLVRETA
ncbi:MAG TPA: chlorite dismutase family protein [Candidatus Polarisedimenticolia bacterium]|nr:chlorite dismutase family protein [Candidatus Polarisedimenticolia bacterium]